MGKKDKNSKKEKAPKVEKSKKAKNSGSNEEETMTKYSGSLALTKLNHVIMKKKNKKGKKIECLVLPIDKNHFVRGKEGAIYMAINVIAKSPQDQYGQNGFVSQNGNVKWSEASEKEKEAFKALPILGNIKNFEDAGGGSEADTKGKAGADIDEDDDLPF